METGPATSVRRRADCRGWIPVLLVLGGVLSGCSRSEPPGEGPTIKPSDAEPAEKAAAAVGEAAQLQQTKELYARHCGACHGQNGDGKGVAARYLFPKPRNFRAGQFRLISTTNTVPTQDDIVAVLKRGMPGSAMPPWPALASDDLQRLADYVMQFRREAIREQEKALAAADQYEMPAEELNEIVAGMTTPGPLQEVPQIGEPDAESIARGKTLYMKSCASCHGKEGKGDGQEKMVDAQGLPTRPRDLTQGIFKGSPDPASVYRRILIGMPGSPMPATRQAAPEEIVDLVHFILSLSDEETREETVLNRETIVAQHAAEIPASPTSPAWDDAAPVQLRLTPLWWRDDFAHHLDVQAMHDGRSIALRISWSDDEANADDARTESFADAVAVELFRGEAEPFVGMGAGDAPIDVWMWDADRQAGFASIEDKYPNMAVDMYPLTEGTVESAEYRRPGTGRAAQAAETLPAQFAENQIAPRAGAPAASALETGGPGSVTFRPPLSQLVEARGEWADGRWTVVMTRELAPQDEAGGVALAAGQRVSVALALWQGSQRDRDGQKLITIWQDLELDEPKQ